MWIETLKFAVEEFKDFFSKQEKKKNATFEAVESIYQAANETESFLVECGRKVEKPNTELTQVWINAASKVRELDKNMYMRLLAKSEYWANPENWTDAKIDKYNIAVNSIRNDCQDMLKMKK